MSRRRPLVPLVPLVLLASGLALAGCGGSGASTHTGTTGATTAARTAPRTAASTATSTSAHGTQMGFEAVPIEQGPPVAPASSTGRAPVHGIRCAPAEQLAYHIHVHLAVFDDGQSRALPGGIGIPGSQVEETSEGPVAVPSSSSCYYWLHTHAPDGIIHIESPTKRIYTLGDFFDEWRQPLTSTRIGDITGRQSWLVDGHPWTKSPRAIPLVAHADIQVSVGQPVVPYQRLDWARTSL